MAKALYDNLIDKVSKRISNMCDFCSETNIAFLSKRYKGYSQEHNKE